MAWGNGVKPLGMLATALLAGAVLSGTAASEPARNGHETPSDRAYRLSWGVRAIGADKLHGMGITGKGATIAVIDSGLGTDAKGLSKNLSNASVDILPRRKVDSQGDRHAVYITETMVGSPDGVGAVGVAYGSQVLSIRADSDGACAKECAFSSLNLAKSLDYALANGARIIDLSLAGDRRLGDKFEKSLAKAAKMGAVVIIAAGNTGQKHPEWPARYAADPRFAGAVVAVGAVNKQGEMAGFSDRAGVTRAAYIAAPGQKVITDCDAETCAIVSGTSFAAPYVSGAVALIMEAFPDMSAREALDVILRSAQTGAGADGDTVYGRGRLDVYKAYKLASAERHGAGGAARAVR